MSVDMYFTTLMGICKGLNSYRYTVISYCEKSMTVLPVAM